MITNLQEQHLRGLRAVLDGSSKHRHRPAARCAGGMGLLKRMKGASKSLLALRYSPTIS